MISNAGSSETRNYAEMGFVDKRDRRKGKPNQAWTALRLLAEKKGSIGIEMVPQKDLSSLQKCIQQIRKVFRNHFGISDDPALR